MTLARSLVPIAALLALAAGCGSDDSSPSSAYGDRSGTEAAAGTEPSAAEGQSSDPAQGGGRPGDSAPVGAAARDCGDEAEGVRELRVSGTGCAPGRAVASSWRAKAACQPPSGASRFSCTVEGYRCLGAAAERGDAVNCVRSGRSISFLAAGRG